MKEADMIIKYSTFSKEPAETYPASITCVVSLKDKFFTSTSDFQDSVRRKNITTYSRNSRP